MCPVHRHMMAASIAPSASKTQILSDVLFEFVGFSDACGSLDVFVFVSSGDFVGVVAGLGLNSFATAAAASALIAGLKATSTSATVKFRNMRAPKLRKPRLRVYSATFFLSGAAASGPLPTSSTGGFGLRWLSRSTGMSYSIANRSRVTCSLAICSNSSSQSLPCSA